MKTLRIPGGAGRILAVAALFGLTALALVAVPIVASADEHDGGDRDRPFRSVSACSDRVDREDPKRDAFFDELVADNVISGDQAAEIDARMDVWQFDGCVARLLFTRGTAIDATATVSNTERREVLGAIVSGQSLADYASGHAVEADALIDAIMASPTAKAAELVAAGELNQADADRILGKIENRVSSGIHETDIGRDRFNDSAWSPAGDQLS